MPLPRWELDESRAPVVVLHVIDSDGRREPDAESLFRALEPLATRRARRAIVIDLTHTAPDAKRRKRSMTWLQAHSASLKEDVIAVAAVAPGAVQRGFIAGALWLVRLPCPVDVFSTRAEALDWIRARLDESPGR